MLRIAHCAVADVGDLFPYNEVLDVAIILTKSSSSYRNPATSSQQLYLASLLLKLPILNIILANLLNLILDYLARVVVVAVGEAECGRVRKEVS
jgi:hypothetical protein